MKLRMIGIIALVVRLHHFPVSDSDSFKRLIFVAQSVENVGLKA
jgi:hypothetical protein